MDEHNWLRDALRGATARQPVAGDRVRAAFGIARRRRQQRLVAGSCAAVMAVFVATTLTGTGAGSSGLKPVSPSESPTATAEPTPTETASPDEAVAPADPTDTPDPAGTDEPGSPVPIDPDLPAHPPNAEGLPVDVYVLLDTTGDMQQGELLDAKLRSVYDRMRSDGVDLRWGLGTFKDIELSDIQQVYRRNRDLAHGYADILSLGTYGGGDPAEADTLALDGTLGVGHAPYTRNDEGASFRSRARKVVLLVTNAPMNQGSAYPTIPSVVARLNASGVMAVAVQVTSSADPIAGTYDDLAEVVGGTGAEVTAPVDCDGDGHRDVRRGEPLVCETDYEEADLGGMADAIVRLALDR